MLPSIDKNEEIVERLVAMYGDGGIWPTADQWRRLINCEDAGRILVIHFFKFRDKAIYPDDPDCSLSGEEAAFGKYAEVARKPIANLGVQKIIAMGGQTQWAIGDGEVWDYVCVMEYPNRRAFLSVFLDEAYSKSHKHRNAGAERHKTAIANIIDLPV